MTPAEKLALTQRSYAAFCEGPDIDTLLTVWHSECEWRMGSMGAAFGTDAFRGHEGLRTLASELGDGWGDSFAVTVDEARITSEGVVLVRGHSSGRSRVTEMELSIPAFWQEIQFRDSLILSVMQSDEPPAGWDEATPIT
jgi:ketosteroid isomerase-like protein